MCSILGFYKLNKEAKVNKTFVKTAMTLMRHRGPDAESFRLIIDSVGLGNQRLSIIDTRKAANQPIEDKKSAIVFNGELYNYLELKRDYLKNVRFQTFSDTEVLQKGLENYGTKFLNKTNGMFACAFFNKLKNELIIARDRFGVKPCHYLIQDKVLYFSSEIKPLIAIKKELKRNIKIYNSFLKDTATDYDENTFIQDIFQVKSGHYLFCKGSEITERKWYFGKDFEFDKSVFDNKPKTIAFFENLLVDAISMRLRSDVPISLTLSAGLDSSTIYTLLKERLKTKVTLFSFVNDKSYLNEISNVKRLVKEYGDQLNEVRSDSKIGAIKIKEALKFLEFPTWDISAIAYLDIYKEIHKKLFKVVVEGHGSDEQLGGYPFMIESSIAEAIKRGNIFNALKLIRIYFDSQGKRKINPIDYVKTYLYIVKKIFTDRKFPNDFQTCCNKVFDYQILPIVLRTFDRLTMANSVESRSPFMDFRIVEFLKVVPTGYKVSEIGTKAILREILKKYHKEYIYKNKRKIGFGVDVSKFKIKEFADWKSSSISFLEKIYGIKND